MEERNETVVLCRDGREVAEIRRRVKRRPKRNLTPDPRLRVELAPGYDPTEPLTEDEWPDEVARGKLRLKEPPARWFSRVIERHALREVPLDAAVACAAAALPPLDRDPFDRVIVALAQAYGLTVLTSDDNIRKYPGDALVSASHAQRLTPARVAAVRKGPSLQPNTRRRR
ncbi:MAG: PIN domain-containing protein [Acidobacteria bacterium]|nr:PIN domain-containing protein [Acidobacteriota bacterium]